MWDSFFNRLCEYLCRGMFWSLCKRFLERVFYLLSKLPLSFVSDESEDEESGLFNGSGWRCPVCSKVMYDSYKVKGEHLFSHYDFDSGGDASVSSVNRRRDRGSVRGELVDSYELDREVEYVDSKDFRCSEDKSRDSVKKDRLFSKWSGVIELVRDKGCFKVGDYFHLGRLRGKDVLLQLKSDLKRMGLEDEFEVDISSGVIRLRDNR